MRKPISPQGRLDRPEIGLVPLNLECRDEIIPILAGLQAVYSDNALCNSILELVVSDVNSNSRTDRGREGMGYWPILVLSAVRLGCGLSWDKLQDLAEQHRALRHIMGIGDWEYQSFDWRCIRDNVCLLQPETLSRIALLVAKAGHRLFPDAPKDVRADTFVVETNIHYPTESSLIRDGILKIIPLAMMLAELMQQPGWRQHEHLTKKARRLDHAIDQICAKKATGYKERRKRPYQKLLRIAQTIMGRARELISLAWTPEWMAQAGALANEIEGYIDLTERVCDNARRRIFLGETVPNEEKIFSIFEPHTQLYKRGKAGKEVQFGRLVMVYEDAAGFIVHHYVLPREARDPDVVVGQTRITQERLDGKIESVSFDRGFHSPENQLELLKIVRHPCLPTRGSVQSVEQDRNATIEFRQSRQRHPGIESAIGALQAGNGLGRCVDRTEKGFERYIGMAVLGRNLHVFGKLVIARQAPQSDAAHSERKPLAA